MDGLPPEGGGPLRWPCSRAEGEGPPRETPTSDEISAKLPQVDAWVTGPVSHRKRQAATPIRRARRAEARSATERSGCSHAPHGVPVRSGAQERFPLLRNTRPAARLRRCPADVMSSCGHPARRPSRPASGPPPVSRPGASPTGAPREQGPDHQAPIKGAGIDPGPLDRAGQTCGLVRPSGPSAARFPCGVASGRFGLRRLPFHRRFVSFHRIAVERWRIVGLRPRTVRAHLQGTRLCRPRCAGVRGS